MGNKFPQKPKLTPVEAPGQPEHGPKSLYVPITELIPGLNTEGLAVGTEETDFKAAQQLYLERRYNDPEVRGSIDTSQGDAFASSISRALFDMEERSPEELTKLQERFRGKVLVDLGSGRQPFGYMIAELLDAAGYVAVDPFNSTRLTAEIKRLSRASVPYASVTEDTLSFLKRIPESSRVDFLSSGTDVNIVSNIIYIKNVIDELKRKLSSDGVIIFNDSIYGDFQGGVALSGETFEPGLMHQKGFVVEKPLYSNAYFLSRAPDPT